MSDELITLIKEIKSNIINNLGIDREALYINTFPSLEHNNERIGNIENVTNAIKSLPIVDGHMLRSFVSLIETYRAREVRNSKVDHDYKDYIQEILQKSGNDEENKKQIKEAMEKARKENNKLPYDIVNNNVLMDFMTQMEVDANIILEFTKGDNALEGYSKIQSLIIENAKKSIDKTAIQNNLHDLKNCLETCDEDKEKLPFLSILSDNICDFFGGDIFQKLYHRDTEIKDTKWLSANCILAYQYCLKQCTTYYNLDKNFVKNFLEVVFKKPQILVGLSQENANDYFDECKYKALFYVLNSLADKKTGFDQIENFDRSDDNEYSIGFIASKILEDHPETELTRLADILFEIVAQKIDKKWQSAYSKKNKFNLEYYYNHEREKPLETPDAPEKWSQNDKKLWKDVWEEIVANYPRKITNDPIDSIKEQLYEFTRLAIEERAYKEAATEQSLAKAIICAQRVGAKDYKAELDTFGAILTTTEKEQCIKLLSLANKYPASIDEVRKRYQEYKELKRQEEALKEKKHAREALKREQQNTPPSVDTRPDAPPVDNAPPAADNAGHIFKLIDANISLVASVQQEFVMTKEKFQNSINGLYDKVPSLVLLEDILETMIKKSASNAVNDKRHLVKLAQNIQDAKESKLFPSLSSSVQEKNAEDQIKIDYDYKHLKVFCEYLNLNEGNYSNNHIKLLQYAFVNINNYTHRDRDTETHNQIVLTIKKLKDIRKKSFDEAKQQWDVKKLKESLKDVKEEHQLFKGMLYKGEPNEKFIEEFVKKEPTILSNIENKIEYRDLEYFFDRNSFLASLSLVSNARYLSFIRDDMKDISTNNLLKSDCNLIDSKTKLETNNSKLLQIEQSLVGTLNNTLISLSKLDDQIYKRYKPRLGALKEKIQNWIKLKKEEEGYATNQFDFIYDAQNIFLEIATDSNLLKAINTSKLHDLSIYHKSFITPLEKNYYVSLDKEKLDTLLDISCITINNLKKDFIIKSLSGEYKVTQYNGLIFNLATDNLEDKEKQLFIELFDKCAINDSNPTYQTSEFIVSALDSRAIEQLDCITVNIDKDSNEWKFLLDITENTYSAANTDNGKFEETLLEDRAFIYRYNQEKKFMFCHPYGLLTRNTKSQYALCATVTASTKDSGQTYADSYIFVSGLRELKKIVTGKHASFTGENIPEYIMLPIVLLKKSHYKNYVLFISSDEKGDAQLSISLIDVDGTTPQRSSAITTEIEEYLTIKEQLGLEKVFSTINLVPTLPNICTNINHGHACQNLAVSGSFSMFMGNNNTEEVKFGYKYAMSLGYLHALYLKKQHLDGIKNCTDASKKYYRQLSENVNKDLDVYEWFEFLEAENAHNPKGTKEAFKKIFYEKLNFQDDFKEYCKETLFSSNNESERLDIDYIKKNILSKKQPLPIKKQTLPIKDEVAKTLSNEQVEKIKDKLFLIADYKDILELGKAWNKPDETDCLEQLEAALFDPEASVRREKMMKYLQPFLNKPQELLKEEEWKKKEALKEELLESMLRNTGEQNKQKNLLTLLFEIPERFLRDAMFKKASDEKKYIILEKIENQESPEEAERIKEKWPKIEDDFHLIQQYSKKITEDIKTETDRRKNQIKRLLNGQALEQEIPRHNMPTRPMATNNAGSILQNANNKQAEKKGFFASLTSMFSRIVEVIKSAWKYIKSIFITSKEAAVTKRKRKIRDYKGMKRKKAPPITFAKNILSTIDDLFKEIEPAKNDTLNKQLMADIFAIRVLWFCNIIYYQYIQKALTQDMGNEQLQAALEVIKKSILSTIQSLDDIRRKELMENVAANNSSCLGNECLYLCLVIRNSEESKLGETCEALVEKIKLPKDKADIEKFCDDLFRNTSCANSYLYYNMISNFLEKNLEHLSPITENSTEKVNFSKEDIEEIKEISRLIGEDFTSMANAESAEQVAYFSKDKHRKIHNDILALQTNYNKIENSASFPIQADKDKNICG